MGLDRLFLPEEEDRATLPKFKISFIKIEQNLRKFYTIILIYTCIILLSFILTRWFICELVEGLRYGMETLVSSPPPSDVKAFKWVDKSRWMCRERIGGIVNVKFLSENHM